MDLRQQQMQQDASRNHSLIGREFYVICPDRNDYYRTVYMKKNPFTGNMQSFLSNPVCGVPPDGMDEMPANLLSKLNCMDTAMPHTI